MSAEFMNGSPARVHRPSGTVQLAPSFFRLTPDQRQFVIQHEIGHYALQTRDEVLADRYAADAMRGRYGLKRTFRSLNGALRETPENDCRRIALYNYLVEYDNRHNGNNMKTIGNAIYDRSNDCLKPYSVVSFDGGGFTFSNSFVPDDRTAPAYPMEAEEFCRWCAHSGVPCSLEALAAYRDAKAEAWSGWTVSGGRDLGDALREITGGGSGDEAPDDGAEESRPAKGTGGKVLALLAVAAIIYLLIKKMA